MKWFHHCSVLVCFSSCLCFQFHPSVTGTRTDSETMKLSLSHTYTEDAARQTQQLFTEVYHVLESWMKVSLDLSYWVIGCTVQMKPAAVSCGCESRDWLTLFLALTSTPFLISSLIFSVSFLFAASWSSFSDHSTVRDERQMLVLYNVGGKQP